MATVSPATIRKAVIGGKDPQSVFEEMYEQYGIPGVPQEGTKTTPPVQRVLKQKAEEERARAEDGASANPRKMGVGRDTAEGDEKDLGLPKAAQKGFTRHFTAAVATQDKETVKALTDSGEVEGATPLVFDPEILSILREEAPVLDVIPQEGQQGFDAKYNILTGRDDPIGYTSEEDAADLSNNEAATGTFTTNTTDMVIYVDLADVSDFTQAAAAHYMNVEDTILGQRVALHARRKAQQIYYGDTSQTEDSGYIGDSNGFDGLVALVKGANQTDKSGTSSNFVDDIKSEIASMVQNENVSSSELVAMTSHTFYDVLQNELGLDNVRARPQDLNEPVNVGGNAITINNVPVMPDSNIEAHTDGSYSAGDEGDVFIFAPRAVRFRSLVPFSQIPLAKMGLSETTALFEFGALIDKSDGNWIRHLQKYNF